LIPNPQIVVSTAIAHNSHTTAVVKQFVNRLSFAIQYGLTFCLYMHSLYEASLGPTLSFQTYTIRQLDLMPKSWNEPLRH